MHDVMYNINVCLPTSLSCDPLHIHQYFKDKSVAINMVKINVDKTDKIFFASGTPYCT